MIKVEVDDRIITIAVDGIISEDDWDVAILDLEEKLSGLPSVHLRSARFPKFHVLMDWEKLKRWEKGARTECTRFCMPIQDMVDRLAVVGDEFWLDESKRLIDIYKHAQVNFYTPIQRQHAVNWLKQADQ